MQAVRGTKPTNLLHTTPVRGSALLAAICLFILFHPICIAGTAPTTADAMLTKAQTLIDKAASIATGVSAVPLYDEPLRLLEKITEKYPEARDANIQAEKLKALCYDRQARYAEKHQALKRYADLVSGGDNEKAANVLKSEADALVEAKETTEAVLIFRMIAKECPDTEAAPEALYKLGKAIGGKKLEEDPKADPVTRYLAKIEYERVMERYPYSEYAVAACVSLSEILEIFESRERAIKLLNGSLDRCVRSQYNEGLFYRLYQMFPKREERNERVKWMQEYLKRYPEGKYSDLFRERVKALEETRP